MGEYRNRGIEESGSWRGVGNSRAEEFRSRGVEKLKDCGVEELGN